MSNLGATGIIMCCIGWLLTGASLLNPNWKVSIVSGSGILQIRFENLWQFCTMEYAGIVECSYFEMLSTVPAHLNICRTLMIVSLLLGGCAMITSILCLQCSIRIGSCTYETKLTITWWIFSWLSGLCCVIVVFWYSKVVLEFKKSEMGVGFRLGLYGASSLIVGGGMLCGHCIGAGNRRPGYQGNEPANINATAAQSAQEIEGSYV